EYTSAPYPPRPCRDRVNELREHVQYLALIVECLVNVTGQNNGNSILVAPKGSLLEEDRGRNPIQRDMEEDSKARLHLTRGDLIEESEDTRVPRRRRHRRHHRAGSHASNEDQMLRGE
ncbi:hypothetical protein PanWU01x14_267200, partial [Parasponia andersonii]